MLNYVVHILTSLLILVGDKYCPMVQNNNFDLLGPFLVMGISKKLKVAGMLNQCSSPMIS